MHSSLQTRMQSNPVKDAHSRTLEMEGLDEDEAEAGEERLRCGTDLVLEMIIESEIFDELKDTNLDVSTLYDCRLTSRSDLVHAEAQMLSTNTSCKADDPHDIPQEVDSPKDILTSGVVNNPQNDHSHKTLKFLSHKSRQTLETT